MADCLLEAEHVRVQYDRTVALRDLNLQLRAGDLLGLVGPNGAGKTTALRAMAGLQAMTAGRVRILGRDVTRECALAMPNVAFASDTPPLYDRLTVEEFLTFIGLSYGLDGNTIDERIGFWLEQLWLTERRKDRVQTLSRGMRQRLAVARTLLPHPPVILLDEPAAGLDPAGRVSFRRLLCSLRDQGKAIVISSHILSDLHEYCTHIAIMSHGEVLQYGTVQQVVNGHENHQCRYRVGLARPIDDILPRMADFAGLSNVQADREEIVFEFVNDPTAAADLLRRLILAGIPVSSFSPMSAGLEEAYLRSGVKQVD